MFAWFLGRSTLINEELQEAWERVPESLCGELLGTGRSRSGYFCALAEDLVIKVQHPSDVDDHIFSENVSEMLFCRHASEEMLQWVARAIWISPDGRHLAIERAEVPAPFLAPRTFPLVLVGDTIASNCGMLHGRFVCTDYPQALWNAVAGAKRLGTASACFYDPTPFRQLEAQCRALVHHPAFAGNAEMAQFHIREAEQHARQAELFEQAFSEAMSRIRIAENVS